MSNLPSQDLDQWTAAYDDPAFLVVEGPNVIVSVRGGCLYIKDGPRNQERERLIPRVPRIVKQLHIYDNHGIVTLDALKWLSDCGIEWSVIDNATNEDHNPRTLATNGSVVEGELMRRQAQCATGLALETTGLLITQRLITEKLEGQAKNAEDLLGDPYLAKFIRDCIERVWLQDNIEAIRGPEGDAAAAYWKIWREQMQDITWTKPRPVDPHWLSYPGRKSLHYSENNDSNRNATGPINAMLNWGYKVAETICTQAIHANWLSPVLGISHTDRKKRDSLALDVIEVLRPLVDSIVWEIASEPMVKAWFKTETSGIVRLRAPLTHRISAAIRRDRYRLDKAMAELVKALREAE